jgi:hypothetical protein
MPDGLTVAIRRYSSRRQTQGVDERGLAQPGIQSRYRGQRGHAVFPHPTIARAEFSDFLDDAVRRFAASQERDNILCLHKPDAVLQATS